MKIRHSKAFMCLSLFFLIIGIETFAQQKGFASYYGNSVHGRLTSSGVRYNKDSLMCAHRTLPFGTKIKVKNLKNDKEVIVTVTDRGPFIKGRVIDLSMAAAKELGMVSSGIAQVSLTPLLENNNPDVVIPNMPNSISLPKLQFLDPKTGNYYSLEEWNQRDAAAKEAARKLEIKKRRAMYMARLKQQQPRWQILQDKMTADAKK